MIFPILVLIVLGTMEIGMVFKDFLAVSAMSREGARIAALSGTNDQADCAVVLGIGGMATSRDLERISEIHIYKASPGSGAQGATNVWVYNGGDKDECHQPSQPQDGWTNQSTAYPVGPGRQTKVGTFNGQTLVLDLVGVRVQMETEWLTGFPPFRGDIHLDESTITRLEPEAFSS